MRVAEKRVVDAQLALVLVQAEAGRGVALGIQVHQQDLLPGLAEGRRQVDRRGALADAALLIHHREDARRSRRERSEVLLVTLPLPGCPAGRL